MVFENIRIAGVFFMLETKRKVVIILVIALFINYLSVWGQTRRITVSGFVHDKETGETLIGAGISSEGSVGAEMQILITAMKK